MRPVVGWPLGDDHFTPKVALLPVPFEMLLRHLDGLAERLRPVERHEEEAADDLRPRLRDARGVPRLLRDGQRLLSAAFRLEELRFKAGVVLQVPGHLGAAARAQELTFGSVAHRCATILVD